MAISSLPMDLQCAILRKVSEGATIGTLLTLRGVSCGFRRACCKLLADVREIRTPLNEERERLLCSPHYYKVILKCCPHLKALKHTAGGDFYLEDFLTIVCSQGRNLTVLEAWFLQCLKNAPSPQLPTLSHLKVLCLRHCGFQSASEKLFNASTFPALQYLDASWCHSLRQWHLSNIWLQLQTLVLRGCEGIDDKLIPTLGNCVTLDCGSTAVTDQGLLILMEVAPHLQQLYLSAVRSNLWNEGVLTEEGLAKVRALRPDVEIHYTDVPADLPGWRTLDLVLS